MLHADGDVTEEMFKSILLGYLPDIDNIGGNYNFAMLSTYAREHNYILAAAFSPSTCNYHIYYVRRDFPDSDAIVSLIRSHPYYFLDDGMLSRDVRDNILPPGYPCHADSR